MHWQWPKIGGFGDFRGENWKINLSEPKESPPWANNTRFDVLLIQNGSRVWPGRYPEKQISNGVCGRLFWRPFWIFSTVTWPRQLSNIPKWRYFHPEHNWALDILCLEDSLLSYLHIKVILAAILKNGGYLDSATNGELTPSKLLFSTFFCFDWYMTHHFFIKEPTGKVFSTTCPQTSSP